VTTDINLAGAVDWVMMQTCFGHHFMLVLEKQEKSNGAQMFCTIIQLIGTKKQAENFLRTYGLMLSSLVQLVHHEHTASKPVLCVS